MAPGGMSTHIRLLCRTSFTTLPFRKSYFLPLALANALIIHTHVRFGPSPHGKLGFHRAIHMTHRRQVDYIFLEDVYCSAALSGLTHKNSYTVPTLVSAAFVATGQDQGVKRA